MTTTLVTYRCPHCEHVMELPECEGSNAILCTAPLCRKEFHIDVPKVQPQRKLIVPCDLQNSENSSAQSSNSLDSAASEEKHSVFTHDQAEQRVLVTFRAVMFRRYPIRFVGYVLMGLVGLTGLIASIFQSSFALALLAGLLLLTAITLMGLWWWRIGQSSITITDVSVVIDPGRKNSRNPKREVHFDQITRIDIYQPFLCKMLKSGSVAIAWGDGKDEEVHIDGVYQPHNIVGLIREQAGK